MATSKNKIPEHMATSAWMFNSAKKKACVPVQVCRPDGAEHRHHQVQPNVLDAVVHAVRPLDGLGEVVRGLVDDLDQVVQLQDLDGAGTLDEVRLGARPLWRVATPC